MYMRILPRPIQCESRSTLYFGRYEYVVSLTCEESWILRVLDRDVIEDKLVTREKWLRTKGQGASRPKMRESIMLIADTLDRLKNKFSHRTYRWNTLHIYTNDVDDVQLLQTVFNDTATIKQAVLVYPQDVIMLVNEPKYPFRTYFKDRHMPIAKKQALWDWVSNQSPDIEASPSTKKWFESNGVRPYWARNSKEEWCRGHFYIDHLDLKHLTMMAMVSPGVTRKTVQVQKRP